MPTQLIILSVAICIIFGGIIAIVVKKARNHSISSIKTLIRQGKSINAIDPLKRMITKDPHNVDAHFLLAKAYMADQKAELAFMEVKMINKLGDFTHDTPEKEFRKLSSELFLQFNQPDEALKDLLLLIKLDPYESDNYYNVGLLFENKSRSTKAINYYKKAIDLNPRHANAYQHLGLIMLNSKRLKEAKLYLDTSIKYDENNFLTYYYLGKISKEARDYNKAIDYFEKSLREKSIKAKSQIEIGICYLALQSNDKAITEFEKVLSMIQRDVDTNITDQQLLYTQYFLSLAYEQERNLDKAITLWEAIQGKKKNFKDVAEKLSQYKELRENDNMKDYLTSSHEEFIEICKNICKIIKLDPQDIKKTRNGVQLMGLESGKKDWKIAKKLPFLVQFLRDSSPVNESTVRNILDEMKNLGVMKGILISSNEITSDAKKFAESRPLDIIGKRKLVKILSQI